MRCRRVEGGAIVLGVAGGQLGVVGGELGAAVYFRIGHLEHSKRMVFGEGF